MSDIPNLSPPKPDFRGYHWHHQFTIPLLFDDCLSLLQKVCALWNKLNDVIDALNDFNDEFNKWATSVETQLKDLYAKYEALDGRVTNCENDIKNIKTSIENIANTLNNLLERLETVENNLSTLTNTVNNLTKTVNDLSKSFNEFKQTITQNINQLTQDLLDLENRIENLENLLENLNIIPPQTILDLNDDDTKWSTLWGNWWDWFSANCINFKSDDSKSNWVMSGNLEWWDTVTKPQRTIKVGYLGQPVCLVKLPFIAVRKNVWTSEPTVAQIVEKSPTFKNDALTPTNAFFDLPLSKEFGFTIDEVKLMTSYIPFVTDKSHVIKVATSESCFATQTDVRIQIPKTGTSAKLCVIPQRLCCAAVPNTVSSTTATAWDLYIYAIAENG